MRQSEEERKRKIREYSAMIRRNDPEEIAEYKRIKEEKLNKIKLNIKIRNGGRIILKHIGLISPV